MERGESKYRNERRGKGMVEEVCVCGRKRLGAGEGVLGRMRKGLKREEGNLSEEEEQEGEKSNDDDNVCVCVYVRMSVCVCLCAYA